MATSATLIMAANTMRKGCLITNNGSVIIYLGMDANVTSSNGLPLTAGSTLQNSDLEAAWRGAIYGAAASSTADVRFWEWGP